MSPVSVIPSVADSSFVATEDDGGGGGSVLMGNMIPSPASAETDSKRDRTTDAKSLFSFFMVFPVRGDVAIAG